MYSLINDPISKNTYKISNEKGVNILRKYVKKYNNIIKIGGNFEDKNISDLLESKCQINKSNNLEKAVNEIKNLYNKLDNLLNNIDISLKIIVNKKNNLLNILNDNFIIKSLSKENENDSINLDQITEINNNVNNISNYKKTLSKNLVKINELLSNLYKLNLDSISFILYC